MGKREGKKGKRGMEMEWDGKDPLAGAYTAWCEILHKTPTELQPQQA